MIRTVVASIFTFALLIGSAGMSYADVVVDTDAMGWTQLESGAWVGPDYVDTPEDAAPLDILNEDHSGTVTYPEPWHEAVPCVPNEDFSCETGLPEVPVEVPVEVAPIATPVEVVVPAVVPVEDVQVIVEPVPAVAEVPAPIALVVPVEVEVKQVAVWPVGGADTGAKTDT